MVPRAKKGCSKVKEMVWHFTDSDTDVQYKQVWRDETSQQVFTYILE